MSNTGNTGVPKILSEHIDRHGADTLRGIDQNMSREELFSRSVAFAVGMATKYRSSNVDLDDLVQQSLVGLWVATEKFDHKTGNGFLTYAKWWCRAYIQDYLCEFSYSIRVPRNVWVARNQEARGGVGIKKGKMSAVSVAAADVVMGGVASLDKYIDDSEKETLLDFLVSGEPGADHGAMCDDISAIFTELDAMPDVYADIVRRYYGIGTGEPQTLEEIGADVGLTRERVRQIRNEAIDYIRSNGGGNFNKIHDYGNGRVAPKMTMRAWMMPENEAPPEPTPVRWDDTHGRPECPKCGSDPYDDGYTNSKKYHRKRYRCPKCKRSGTGTKDRPRKGS